MYPEHKQPAFQFCYIQLPPFILKQKEPFSTKVIYSIWSAQTFLLIYFLYKKSWYATLPWSPRTRIMVSLITDCSKYLEILTGLNPSSQARGEHWYKSLEQVKDIQQWELPREGQYVGSWHRERGMRMYRAWSTLMTCVKEELNIEHTKRTPVQFTASKKADLHTWFWHWIGHGLRDFVVDEFNTFTGKESNLE